MAWKNRAWLRKRVREAVGFWYDMTKGRQFVGSRLGLKLLFDLNSTIDKQILAFKSYEEKQTKILFGAAQDGKRSGEICVFLDIGANWGIYSLLAEQLKIFDRIVAVEADPRNVSQLYANLFLNNLSGAVEVISAAASDKAEELEFCLAPNRSRDVSQAGTEKFGAGWTKIAIPAVRMDDILKMTGGFIASKVDTEGFEEKVINGMNNLLVQNRCCLQVEVFPDALPKFDAQMVSLGFQKFAEIGPDRFYKNY